MCSIAPAPDPGFGYWGEGGGVGGGLRVRRHIDNECMRNCIVCRTMIYHAVYLRLCCLIVCGGEQGGGGGAAAPKPMLDPGCIAKFEGGSSGDFRKGGFQVRPHTKSGGRGGCHNHTPLPSPPPPPPPSPPPPPPPLHPPMVFVVREGVCPPCLRCKLTLCQWGLSFLWQSGDTLT